jgi:toxin ParE1/3/4
VNVVLQPAAQRDLEEITDFLDQRSLQVAIRFTFKASETFDKLLSMPGLGSLLEIPNPALLGVRAWPIRGFKNYIVFYRARDYGIEILRVLHGARDIEKIFEK